MSSKMSKNAQFFTHSYFVSTNQLDKKIIKVNKPNLYFKINLNEIDTTKCWGFMKIRADLYVGI